MLWEKFQGRVYLVKNVFAKPETLAAMYGDHCGRVLPPEARARPAELLRDDFLERTFGELLESGGLDDQD